MKSLVIGGTGQLGANLVRVLLEHGHTVRVLHRSFSRIFTLDGLSVEHVEGDLNDGISLRRACEGMQVVYHVAGYYPRTTIPVNEAKRQALKETHMLLEAIRNAGNERLVFASSLSTIGFPRQPGRLANETCSFSTRFTNNPYLMAKVAMEDRVLQAGKQGIPAVVIVPTEFFGAYDQRPTSGTQILMIAKGKMPFYVPGPVNVIDVRDVAVAMMRAAERGRIGERYLVGNWNTTQHELYDLIAEVSGVSPPQVPVPFSLARWAARVGEWIACARGWPPEFPLIFLEVMAHMQHYDCSKALRELEYPRSSISHALEDAVRWFRDHGYLPGASEG
ncbi:MAG: NAD-dependent epimerase/dehydratase family protein [Nitrospirales bacterium]